MISFKPFLNKLKNFFVNLPEKIKKLSPWQTVIAPVIASIIVLVIIQWFNIEKGKLHVRNGPNHTVIYLNDDYKAEISPNEKVDICWINPGVYILSVKENGLRTMEKEIHISSGEITTIQIGKDSLLSPEDKNISRYSLIIQASPKFEREKIYIDGEWKGNTPFEVSLEEGEYIIRLESNSGIYEEAIILSEDKFIYIDTSDFK